MGPYKRRRVVKRPLTILKTPLLEKKYHDVNYAASISSAGVVVPLSDIIQGDTNTNRDGTKILPVSMQVRWEVLSGDVENAVRFILFQAREWTVGTPAVADILDLSGNPGIDPLAKNKKGNYGFIYDSGIVRVKKTYFSIGDVDMTFSHLDHHPGITFFPRGSDALNFKLTKKKNLKNRVAYDGSTATTGSGRFFVMIISGSGLVPHPTAYINTRFVFRDV